MKRYKYDEIRGILSKMERGTGYFDFNIVEVCFNEDGVFKVYHNDKIREKTKSMKEASEIINRWMSI